jgi:Nucleoside diphosphate kinase
MDLASKILNALPAVAEAEEPSERWISPLRQSQPAGRNHFVLFLKPEALALEDGVNVEDVLEFVLSKLRANGVKTGAVRLLNGPYLGRYRIMEAHYGVINRASRLGEAALSQPTKKKLMAECLGVGQVLGAHQFLGKYPDVSAFALNILADTLGTKKVASGKYYGVFNVGGEKVIVLNPFHPQQLLHYTQSGRAIAVFECSTDTDWIVLRNGLTGATDPTRAAPGSIRRTLLDRKSELGLRDVSTANNGVHCSAGPLEAMAEYVRFFSDHANGQLIDPEETPFGRLLAKLGLSKKDIAGLAKNPLLGRGADATYAFNLTEEKDSDAAADLLAGASRKKAAAK